jgi:hypothetical protein
MDFKLETYKRRASCLRYMHDVEFHTETARLDA